MYDVFICHASEDKENFVEPLANALEQNGLKVWYDGFELKWGNSLREKVDHGLANSKYGVVVLSPYFFKKRWPNAELDALVAWEMEENREILLPICHNITIKGVRKYSPLLAGKCYRKSSDGLDKLVKEIASLCKGYQRKRFKNIYKDENDIINQAILSASGIQRALDEGRIIINPEPTQKKYYPFGTCTVDLRLDKEITIIEPKKLVLDLSKTGEFVKLVSTNSFRYTLTNKKPYLLEIGKSILCRTLEMIALPCDKGPPYLAAKVEAKASRTRLGLVCFSPPIIEPGFQGSLCLQMINLGMANVLLYPEIPFVSIHFLRVDSDPYFRNYKTSI